MMRGACWLLFVVPGCAAAPPSAQAPASPASPQPFVAASAVASPQDALPAGIYFRSSSYKPCNYVDGAEARGLCTDPTHAVVATEIASSSLEARAVGRRLAGLPLAAGYPVVTHTDELGMADERRGIVFVLGLFAAEAPALRWSALLGSGVEVVRLVDEDEMRARAERFASHGRGPMVTRLRSGDAVVVYRGVVQEPIAEGEEPIDLPPDGAVIDDREPELHAVCTLPPGSPVLADRERAELGYYRWLPVTCDDGRAGWVRWSETMMHATVVRVPGESERYELVRLAGAQCDSPFFEVHAFTPDGGRGRVVAKRVGGGPC